MVPEIKLVSESTVVLVDHMGDDKRVVDAARVSTGKNDEVSEFNAERDSKLIQYLMKNQHETPFEKIVFEFHVKTPLFVTRQVMRHRIGCLPDYTKIKLTNGKEVKSMRLDKLYRLWNLPPDVHIPGLEKEIRTERENIKQSSIRSVDELTGKVTLTYVRDIVFKGEQEVFRFVLSNGTTFDATLTHRVLTEIGWRTLERALAEDLTIAAVSRFSEQKDDIHYDIEFWKKDRGHKDYKDDAWVKVESKRTIKRRIRNEKDEWIDVLTIINWDAYEVHPRGWIRGIGETDKPTGNRQWMDNRGHNRRGHHKGVAVTHAFVGGRYKMVKVHILVAKAFIPQIDKDKDLVCHIDDNTQDNHVENLKWGDAKSNHADAKANDIDSSLKMHFLTIDHKESLGMMPTYDIEVDNGTGQHNFLVNDVVVHNSFNEMSGRYRKLEMEFYLPEELRLQGQEGTKQGSHTDWDFSNSLQHAQLQQRMIESYTESAKVYDELMGANVANEISRLVLPVSMMTEFYWTINARALFNFLQLRLDAHAQKEIQELAQKIENIVKPLIPHTYAAFEKHILKRGIENE
jgi:thymidylate synthase ThyX